MISLRPFNPENDLATLQQWWRARGQTELPLAVLPRGWVASASGLDVAASFLYIAEGKIGVIEWTTTNPRVAAGPDVVEAVKALYVHLEGVAWEAGCPIVISFVAEASWESRTLVRRGYTPAGGAHVMLVKPFDRKEGDA